MLQRTSSLGDPMPAAAFDFASASILTNRVELTGSDFSAKSRFGLCGLRGFPRSRGLTGF